MTLTKIFYKIKGRKTTEKRNQNLLENYHRVEYYNLGDKTFVVVAEESDKARETPLDIMKRLLNNQSENIRRDNAKRTCYLQTNGGTKC